LIGFEQDRRRLPLLKAENSSPDALDIELSRLAVHGFRPQSNEFADFFDNGPGSGNVALVCADKELEFFGCEHVFSCCKSNPAVSAAIDVFSPTPASPSRRCAVA
jgi:hypothetical protein